MNKPVKIVFGLNDFLVGGMQRQFAEQIKYFDTELFEIVLITLFEFPSESKMYDELPDNLIIYHLNFNGMFDIAEWLRLLGLLRRTSPDIVVSSLFFSNTVFRILKPLVGYVSIAREHNTYVDRSIWQKRVNRILARLSYKIVGVSKTVVDFVSKEERIPREKFIVIHNGVDAKKIQEKLDSLPTKIELKKEFGFQESDKIFLNVARLTKQKNHKLLIDGFEAFNKKYPQYKLAIVGGGSLLKELEAYADKNEVTFFGNRSDVWKFYKMADAFVSTSMIEGLSNAYLESLSSSLPLISTKTAGTDELLESGKNGYIIKNDTLDAVEEALIRASTSNMNLLRENARETANLFSIKDTVRNYQDLFLRAVKHHE